MKNIRDFLSENFQFLEVKFSTYFNRRVFVMHFHSIKFESVFTISIRIPYLLNMLLLTAQRVQQAHTFETTYFQR